MYLTGVFSFSLTVGPTPLASLGGLDIWVAKLTPGTGAIELSLMLSASFVLGSFPSAVAQFVSIDFWLRSRALLLDFSSARAECSRDCVSCRVGAVGGVVWLDRSRLLGGRGGQQRRSGQFSCLARLLKLLAFLAFPQHAIDFQVLHLAFLDASNRSLDLPL